MAISNCVKATAVLIIIIVCIVSYVSLLSHTGVFLRNDQPGDFYLAMSLDGGNNPRFFVSPNRYWHALWQIDPVARTLTHAQTGARLYWQTTPSVSVNILVVGAAQNARFHTLPWLPGVYGPISFGDTSSGPLYQVYADAQQHVSLVQGGSGGPVRWRVCLLARQYPTNGPSG